MKKSSVILVFAVLSVLFFCAIFIYPKTGIEPTNRGYEYMDTVFDPSKVATVDIELDEEDLTTILANAANEEIVQADVTINGTTVHHVGLRTKGNLSLRSVVQMEDSERYSFKIDFDYYDNTQSLNGLKKLSLNNNYSDASQMREYMSYKMMEELGVATPGYSYMYVTINGKEWGLYLGVEAIEETFLARNFNKGTGSLYKPDGVGSDLKYISDEYDDYTGINPKTSINAQDEEQFIDFITTINTANTDLESVLNVDEMLRYFAANTALVNLDHYQGNMKHNYYLYEEDGKFSILPWDYNMSLGGFGADMAGGGPGGFPFARDASTKDNQNLETPAIEGQNNVPPFVKSGEAGDNDEAQGRQPMGIIGGNALSDSNINFSIYEPVSGTTMEERPLINALLSSEENITTYEKYISNIATSFLAEENFTKMVDEVHSLILPYVQKDPTSFYTVEEFEKDVYGDSGIIQFASKRSNSILAQVSGELVVENSSISSNFPSFDPNTDSNSNEGANANQGMLPPNGSQFPEGMQPPNGGQFPEGMQPPNGGQFPEGMQPPNGGQFPEGMQPPNGGQFPEGMQPPNGGQFPWGMQPPNGSQETIDAQSARYSKSMIIISIIGGTLLLLLTYGISKFKRRKE